MVNKVIDITGQKFHRLTVLSFDSYAPYGSLWKCRCDCGNELLLCGKNLRSGNTKSCGCLRRESISKRSSERRTHGMTTRSGIKKEYRTWAAMKNRCTNINHHAYSRYGGRDIKVCDRWMKFENFYEDMGERPEGTTLDRINNDGNYYKENCRWATRKEQQNNRRNNVWITHNGKTMNLGQWAKEWNVPRDFIDYRLKIRKSVEQIVKDVEKKHPREIVV